MAIKGGRTGPKSPITGLNARQEAFCCFIVAGYDYANAYEAAGYDVGVNGGQTLNKRAAGDSAALRPAATNLANKLMQMPKIKARIETLQREQHANNEKMRSEAMERWAFDIEKTTRLLLEDRHFARTGQLDLPEPGYELVRRDPPPQEWRPDPRAAVQATMGLAKLHGLLIDRKEVTVIDAMQNMNNEELIGFISKLQRQLGPVIDVEVDPSIVAPSRYSRLITAEVIEEETVGEPDEGVYFETDETGEAYE